MPTYIEYVHARPHDDEILFALAKALDFTAEDVVANRRGSISVRQRLRVLQDELLVPIALLAGAMLFSLLVRLTWAGYVEHKNVLEYTAAIFANLGTFHFSQFFDLYFRTNGESLPKIVTVFVGASPLPVLKKLIRINWRNVFDAALSRVREETGVVNTISEVPQTRIKKEDKVEFDYFVVNGRKLRVNSAAMSAIAHGYQYRVYFLRPKNTILSLEPVPRT